MSFSTDKMISVTALAPVNIAVIKYWGKRDEKLILPVNGSLSVTLDKRHLHAKTTIATSPQFVKDRFWLNSQEKSLENDVRLQNVLKEIRRRARKRRHTDDGESSVGSSMVGWKVHICSENNFPTAAGLASSAAGFACLVFALAKLYNVEGDISDIARRGSGSACRSVYGGFVEWLVGTAEDGSDSIARPVASADHWPNMAILVLVVSADRKHTSSTEGMQTSVETSELLRYRADHVVPDALARMKHAINHKDFNLFASLTMKDSNQMHAVCLDTFPPIIYLTDTSRDIIRLVNDVNTFYKTNRVAYTFDAGPNACLYMTEDIVPLVLSLVKHFFPPLVDNGQKFLTGNQLTIPKPDQEILPFIRLERRPGAIKYVINTKVGSGPEVIGNGVGDAEPESLLDCNGWPRNGRSPEDAVVSTPAK